jgi:hypothetical protein
MAHFLGEQGNNCHDSDLESANGLHGRANLADQADQAEKLKVYIDPSIGSAVPATLIGFRMGTTVSRYDLQVLGGASQ